MSSSLPPLPSSSSSTTSSSSANGNNNDGGGSRLAGSSTTRRGDDYEGPSRSRPRGVYEVWPEPFLEALATHIAADSALFSGRLSAAQALSNVFQVCSTWRAVSRSELLWQRLTHRIWHRSNLLRRTWREEFIYRHRTARNFRTRRSVHFNLGFDPADIEDPTDPNAVACRCLALSDHYLAAGFADGTVRIFDLRTRLHAGTYRPLYRDRLGPFSRAVSGIILTRTRLVFASLDGDIHVANLLNGPHHRVVRRARLGDLLNDGALVDFAGCEQWWVGLYAGVPGRAFHIWSGLTEELTFVGGSLTDPYAVAGWRTLTESSTELVGRVRVTRGGDSAVACTSARVMVFDLRNQGVILGEEEYGRGVIVGCTDVWNEAYVTVDGRGAASVRRVETMEEICRFGLNVGRSGGRAAAAMNGGYAMICGGGVVRVWGIEGREGEYLYRFGERVQGEVNAMVADERHVATAVGDTVIHLWDFGAEED
ncbi:Transcriptional regulator STERILE APETALA [Linum grandiflorum]